MSGEHPMRVVLEQQGPYAFCIDFEGAAFASLISDEPAPLGAGEGSNPGELLGARQTGLAGFRIAGLMRDADLLPQVHALADRLLADAPGTADRIVERWVGGAERYASA